METAKKSTRSVFHHGHGVELSGDVFLGEEKGRVNEKAAVEAEKAAKASATAAAKVLKAAQEKAWKQETEGTKAEVEKWNLRYGDMSKALLKTIGAPKRPTRRLKAAVYAEVATLLAGEVAGGAPLVSQDTPEVEEFTSQLRNMQSDNDDSEYSPDEEE